MLLVIPARGGSRGIPRKALAEVHGRPLIWYTLDYVKRHDLEGSSVVVTDCDAIEDYVSSSGFGLDVVREPRAERHQENVILATYRALRSVEMGGASG